MNRRRTEKHNLGWGSISLLIVAAVVIAGAGVFHAYIKNRQIYLGREVEAAEQRIVQSELRIRTLQMLLDEQMNRYLIRDRLREMNSDLRPIPGAAVQVIDPRNSGQPLPDLAQGGP